VVRRIRLISGLILFSYLVTHFVNHSLGLVSLAVMERGLIVAYGVWGSSLGGLVLYGAFTVHFALALYALWQRRTLRMPAVDAVQYVMGFAVPLLAIQHVVNTRIADGVYGADVGYYSHIITVLWRISPFYGYLQVTLLIVAWIHASIGLRFWLRVRPWYDQLQPFLFAFALLLPVLALLGFASAGREINAIIEHHPEFLAAFEARVPSPAVQRDLQLLTWALRGFFVGTIALLLAARILRVQWQRRHGITRIVYPDGRFIEVTRGISVLEASRMLGIPHASVCGGKGRCSTCRVRVRAATGAVPPPTEAENKVLNRIKAGPNVRLACMLRPRRGPIEVTPLLPAFASARDGRPRPGYLQGREQEIAIMFADLRAFTRLAETKLPYDVVFLLNRYFAAMGRAIEEAGGRVDKFIGDGIMALFGLDSGPNVGCQQAIKAAELMSRRLEELNRALEHDLETPLRIGIGVHTGPAIVGEMGYGRTISVTAVGDAVNTASRLEALTKEFSCEFVVSEAVIERAGYDWSAVPSHEIEVRGRRAPLRIRIVARAGHMPEAAVVAEPAAGSRGVADAAPA
jgi:adenylate cyclase